MAFLQLCDDILFDNKVYPLPSFSLGFATPEKDYSKSLRLLGSENLVSHRAAMSMLYLRSFTATGAVRLSGRSAASRTRRVLTLCCAIISSFLLLLSS